MRLSVTARSKHASEAEEGSSDGDSPLAVGRQNGPAVFQVPFLVFGTLVLLLCASLGLWRQQKNIFLIRINLEGTKTTRNNTKAHSHNDLSLLEDDAREAEVKAPVLPSPDGKDTIYQQSLELLIEERKEEANRAHLSSFFHGLLQEGMYPRVYPLQDMFLGSAVPHVKNRTDNRLVFPAGPGSQTQAICKWISSNLHEHFPHIMQELLRCFSWWQANQQQTPVLVLDDKELKQEYAKDFVGVLEKSFGVQVVKNRLFLPNKTDSNFVYTDVNIYSQPPHLVERAWFQIHNLQDAALLRQETLKYAKEIKERDDRNLAEATTNELLGGCPGEGGPLSASKKQPVIAFLNRNGDRHVENIGDILEALKKTKVLGHTLGILDIHYISSFDQLSFWEQVDVMSKVDIVIGPHGAQFTSVAFLPACGGLFELFPKGYYYPNYFGSLARTTGHYHFHLYTGGMNIDAELNQDMMTLEGRMEARSRHVIANVDLVLQGVQQLAERWQSCCERRLQGGTVESLF